jgi:mono/diheme cytochrome c family protein
VGASAAWAGGIVLAGLAVVAGAGLAQPRSMDAPLPGGQSNFIEYCSGCHGLRGVSAPARVPQLKEQVGAFLCTQAGRDYLVRLPNVSHAPIASGEDLAAVLNYVVFGLGGRSVPSGAQPFTAEEVERLRKSPIKPGASLLSERRRIVAEITRRCGAPVTLADYSAPKPAPR